MNWRKATKRETVAIRAAERETFFKRLRGEFVWFLVFGGIAMFFS